LAALLADRERAVAALEGELRLRDLMIDKLKHQLAGLRHHRFGAHSESLDRWACLWKIRRSPTR